MRIVKSQYDNEFDKMLTESLQKYHQPVPVDFAEKMLKQIRQDEEKQILERVVMQEKLALASCIVLAVVSVIAVVFSDIIFNVTREFVPLITKTCESVIADFYTVCGFTLILTAIFGCAIYFFADLLTENG